TDAFARKHQAKLLSNGVNVDQRSGDKTPVVRLVSVSLGVAPQQFGLVMFGVEGDRQQPPVFGRIRRGGKFLASVGKVARHSRAKVRKRAARVDERERQGLALEIREMNH